MSIANGWLLAAAAVVWITSEVIGQFWRWQERKGNKKIALHAFFYDAALTFASIILLLLAIKPFWAILTIVLIWFLVLVPIVGKKAKEMGIPEYMTPIIEDEPEEEKP